MYKLVGLVGLLSLGMIGCDGGGSTGVDPDDPGDVGGNPEALPDPFEGLAYEERCDGFENSDGEFQPIPGILGSWVGEFQFVGEADDNGDVDLTGTETLKVFGNDQWLEDDPDVAMEECEAVYTVTGTLLGDCSTDMCLSFNANLDNSATTCSAAWAAAAYGDSYGPVDYNVSLTCGDGDFCDATVNFTASGNLAGMGEAAGDRLQFRTETFCAFY